MACLGMVAKLDIAIDDGACSQHGVVSDVRRTCVLVILQADGDTRLNDAVSTKVCIFSFGFVMVSRHDELSRIGWFVGLEVHAIIFHKASCVFLRWSPVVIV